MASSVTPSRREFLHDTACLAGAGLWGCVGAGRLPLLAGETKAGAAAPRLKVAAIFTVLRYRSHAYHFLHSFLEPYVFDGRKNESGMDVVSFYADQFPAKGDMARDVSQRYRIPLYKTIEQALCLGGQTLAVDAVLLIGEHGEYPFNNLGQHEYPRKQFFDEIARVVEKSGRQIPVFNDKHLSHRWDWSKEMYDTAKRLKMPFMAGSSVPLAQRVPALELPAGSQIEEAVSVHGGPVESYDFHALEILQSLVESRRGGETGVSRVQFLDGPALGEAARQGRWSRDVFRAALEAEVAARPELAGKRDLSPTHGILIDYKDGLKGAALRIEGGNECWNFACRLAGEQAPRATHFYVGPWGNQNLFMALSHAVQYLFREKNEPYAVERTLLTGGVLDAAMHSRRQEGESLATPQLEFAYAPIDFRRFRETGATWKLITKATPEPDRILPGGLAGLAPGAG